MIRLRGSLKLEHTLARRGAERLWSLMHDLPYVTALGALTGNQAVQQVKAGLKAIYLSGWQVAGDANLGETTYPDQSLYPANSVPVGRAAHQQRAAPRRPDPLGRGQERPRLVRADRRRRRGGLRRRAQRLRVDALDDRGRRCGRPLRGPARVGEEVRPSRRQGARADGAVHPHADRGAARGRRRGRAERADRAHGRAVGDAAHVRPRPARPRVRHRRADGGGVLPRARRPRPRDPALAGLRAVRGRPLVRDVDARHGRGAAVRGGDPRGVSRASCSRTTARRRSTGRRRSTTTRSRASRRTSARWATSSSSSRSPASTR